jgi:hypothetical protein
MRRRKAGRLIWSSLGIYTYFPQTPIIVNNVMEVPKLPGITLHHILTFSLSYDKGQINHVVNDTGVMAKQTATPMIRFGDYVGH